MHSNFFSLWSIRSLAYELVYTLARCVVLSRETNLKHGAKQSNEIVTWRMYEQVCKNIHEVIFEEVSTITVFLPLKYVSELNFIDLRCDIDFKKLTITNT